MNEIAELKQLSLPDNNFITDYDTAEQIVTSAIQSHYNYWKLIKECQEHISGKKPTTPDKLKKKGMGWANNWNYGKARAKLEKTVAESSAKISDALALGYVIFRDSKKDDARDEVLSFMMDQNKRGVVSSILAYSLYFALSREYRISDFLNQSEYPSISFGYCSMLFYDNDWLPDPTHPLDIAFAPRSTPTNIPTFVTFDVIDAIELYGYWIKTHNNGEEWGGWKKDGLEEVLLKAFKGKTKDNKVFKTWEEVIPLYEEKPSYCILNTEAVSIAKIYNREVNGDLTETYIAYDQLTNYTQRGEQKRSATISGSKILFQKNWGKVNIHDKIIIVKDSGFTSESGFIQDLRGISKFSVEDSIRYNRLRNGAANKAVFAGSPWFERGPGQAENFKITVSQGFVVFNSGYAPIEKQPTFDISSHLNLIRFEEGEYTRETQQYDASIQGRLTSRPNKGEVQRITEEVEVTNAAKNSVKLRDYAKVFHQVLKRIPSIRMNEKDAGKEGLDRFYSTAIKNLKVFGVKTKEDIDKIIECVDTFILDPVVKDIDTITVAIQMAETPFGRNRLKRMHLVASGMPIEEVNTAIPLVADKYYNLQDARMATIENDMFFTTNEVVVAGTDDHIEHLKHHFAKNDRVIQGVQEQRLSPVDAFKYLENNIIHCQSHINFLAQDPILGSMAEEHQNRLNEYVKAKNAIQAQAAQMMQQQAQQAGQIPLDPKTEAEIARDDRKAQADQNRKDWIAQERTKQRYEQIENQKEIELEKVRNES